MYRTRVFRMYKLNRSVYNDNMSKGRIIKLLRILEEQTDYEHPLNAEELITLLEQEGEPAERKAIYSDIKTLNEAGYSIEFIREQNLVGYYFDSPVFEPAELRVLSDAVVSSNFITERKTDEMLGKLHSLTNKYNREMMEKTIMYRHNKTSNEQILYNVSYLQEALFNHKQISFDYFDFTIDGQKKYRREERYATVPYCLLLYQGRYYLIGFDEKHNNFLHYRVDRMEKLEVEDTGHVFREFDPNDYVQRIFQMFTGEGETVKLRCPHKLASEVIDKFGESVIVTVNTADYFEVSARIELSQTFLAWVFTFGGEIRIMGPEKVINAYREACLKEAEGYGK